MRKQVVTTVLTIGGVLVAGSAAALVNSSILGGTSASIVAGDAPAGESLGTGPLGTDLVPVSGTTLPSGGNHVSGTVAEYPVGASGTVTIDTADDGFRIVSIDTSTGWTVTHSEDGDDVRVVFRSSISEVTFRASLLYGVVNTSVQTRALPSPGHDSTDDSSDHGSDDSVDDGSDDGTEITEPEDDDTEDSEPEDSEVDDDSVDDTVDDKSDD